MASETPCNKHGKGFCWQCADEELAECRKQLAAAQAVVEAAMVIDYKFSDGHEITLFQKVALRQALAAYDECEKGEKDGK